MNKEFVMRGQTANAGSEVLNFSGYKPGYAYRLVEFELYSTTNLGITAFEGRATITAAKTAEDPVNPNFNNEGLIASAMFSEQISSGAPGVTQYSIINNEFLITQNLILAVRETDSGNPVNWQCRFVAEKMNDAETAVTNYKQYQIFDE